MKKTYLLMVAVLAALLLFATEVFAADEVQVDSERFMCRSLYSDNAVLLEQEDGSLVISFRSGAPVLDLTTPELSEAEACNAIRIVLKNNSTCNSLTVLYTVEGEDREICTSITRRSGKTEYFFYLDDIQSVSALSLSFSGAYNGTIELYSVSAVSVYDDSAAEPGSILDCVYDFENRKIRISGTVDHEIAVNTRNATVELYAFGMDETIANFRINNTSPIATTPLSVRFEFEVPEVFFSDRFLQYVVAIMSPEGKVLYFYTPRIPCIEESDDARDSLPFKGVFTEYTTLAARADVGLAIVDVYLDRLQSQKNNGLVHIVDGRYFYIDRSYVYELDDIIGRYRADGCRVYLRFLLSGDVGYTILHGSADMSSDAAYYGISLAGDTARLTLFAYTDFLCARYAGETSGNVDGIVVGRAVDNAAEYNYVGNPVLQKYTEIYGNALYMISQAAKASGRNVDIVVPVTNLYDDGRHEEVTEGRYLPSLFLTSLCKMMSDRFGSGFTVRVMLEDCTIPDALLGDKGNAEVMSAEIIDNFESSLQWLSSTYGRIKDGYLYYWAPEGGVDDQMLMNAYIYTYYRQTAKDASCVILSTENLGKKTDFEALFDTVKYMDTQMGLNRNSGLLLDLGESEWASLMPWLDPLTLVKRNMFVYVDHSIPSAEAFGSYVLWDSQQGRSVYDWYVGADGSLSVKDVETLGRVLVARLTPSEKQAGYSEVIYAFSADEIMSVVDMLSVDVFVDGSAGQSYQLIFEICGDASSCEVSAVVESGVHMTIYLNTLKLDESDRIRNIRIFSVPAEGYDEYSLCIGQLAAHSNTLDDDSLEKEILRMRLTSTANDSGEATSHVSAWQGGALLISLLLCVSAFVVIALSRKGE